ncbi:hypothetical protein [Streptomyces rugosispiralis]|uniref:Uncharacterized protein n=1 Tax=Streptomyces rugosispiralis TaxID=2967341 RepID=A0ABT1USP5_9ACTN|nr:hypothetical protein [Streptomyces rugosispiralis]MCQ8188139.1 hypothetical protein [Streptomyces rugosispiralis]
MSAPREPHLPPAQAPWVAERGDKLRVTAVRTFLTTPQGCPHLFPAFGVQEAATFREPVLGVFPGAIVPLRTTDGSVRRP